MSELRNHFELNNGMRIEFAEPGDARISAPQRETIERLNAPLAAIITTTAPAGSTDARLSRTLLDRLIGHDRIVSENLYLPSSHGTPDTEIFAASEELLMAMTECAIIEDKAAAGIRYNLRPRLLAEPGSTYTVDLERAMRGKSNTKKAFPPISNKEGRGRK